MNLLRSLIDPSAAVRRRCLRWALLLLLLAACGLRVWLVVQYNPLDHRWSDPARHWDSGTRPLETSPMSVIDPILYQLYISVLAKVRCPSNFAFQRVAPMPRWIAEQHRHAG